MSQSHRLSARPIVAVVAVAVSAVGGAAHAAHPLVTEDTGTQGAGNVEVENGLSWTKLGGAKVFTYQPQISYGLTSSVDVIVQPAWLSSRDAGGSSVRGFGDTNLDAKWRFYGAAPWSLGVRAGATLATNQKGLGLPHGEVGTHAVLVATYDDAPLTVHGNLGVARNPNGSGLRTWIGSASSAVMWAASEELILTAELDAAANPDPARQSWIGSWLAGAIYTVRPGLDVDVGYSTQLQSTLRARTWLLGLTYRFAP